MTSLNEKGQQIHQVVIESVTPLTQKQKLKIKNKLSSLYGEDGYSLSEKVNEELLAGVILKIDSIMIDSSLRGQIQKIKEELLKEDMSQIDGEYIKELFRKKISSYKPTPVLNEIGNVLSVSDGIAIISGLHNIEMGEIVTFESEALGLVLGLNLDTISVAILNKPEGICENTKVFRTHHKAEVPVGMEMLGRVVNALGEPIDGKKHLNALEKKKVNAEAPSIISRDSVTKPVQTGIKGIDALVPIGRGQRELIIGDRQTGKTSLIIDMILSQKSINEQAKKPQDKMYCVYVAIGQKQSSVRDLVQVLQKNGALEYTVVVSATAGEMAAMQYLAPYTGCTIAEYFRDHGLNAIIFYDDLSKHAVAYRELSLLLKRPPGREAYPGDVFYIHSRLLERAAQLDGKSGGGSLTAIPVIETQEGDVSAYIPTNVISITDGQIFLETNLFNQGIRPAINVGLSVSRVGSAAQTKAVKKVSGTLKLDLAQYREMLSFSQFSSDLDKTTQKMLHRGARLTQILKQEQCHPYTFAQEVVSLYAGVNGYLDEVKLEDVSLYEKNLQQHLQEEGIKVLDSLKKTNELTFQIEKDLSAFIENFTKDFIENLGYDKSSKN